jgi:hydrogenase maturation protease
MNGSTCIACVGNELAKDDGIGMRIGRVLNRLPLPEGVYVRFYPQVDLDLIDDILSVDRLILCDATRTGIVPGTVTVCSWQDVASLSRQPTCCHGIGLAELVQIAAELAPARRDVVLVGVEAETLDEFGNEFSDAVQAALPIAVARVLALVSADANLVALAQATARDLPAPDAMSAFGG